MKSLERLIEVLETVNPHLYPEEARILREAAAQLRLAGDFGTNLYNAGECLLLADQHRSEHIRSLALEAISRGFQYALRGTGETA